MPESLLRVIIGNNGSGKTAKLRELFELAKSSGELVLWCDADRARDARFSAISASSHHNQMLAAALLRVLPVFGEDSPGLQMLVEFIDRGLFPVRRGPERTRLVPVGSAPSGCRSIISIVDRLIAKVFAHSPKPISADKFRCSVFIDEIDAHLCPAWQRLVVPALTEVFPLVKFTVTTNSPLTLTSFDACEIVKLRRNSESGEIEEERFVREPGMQTATELLSNYFGVQQAGRPSLIAMAKELNRLRSMQLMGEE